MMKREKNILSRQPNKMVLHSHWLVRTLRCKLAVLSLLIIKGCSVFVLSWLLIIGSMFDK